MKIIVLKDTRQVKYIVQDTDDIELLEDRVILPDGIVSDMNESTVEVIFVDSVPENTIGSYYTTEFISEINYNTNLKKELLSQDLYKLRGEVANLITEITLLNDGLPPQIADITTQIKTLYSVAKTEISELDETTVDSYVLRGPQAQQLLTFLKSFL